jgi:hypothetical protein
MITTAATEMIMMASCKLILTYCPDQSAEIFCEFEEEKDFDSFEGLIAEDHGETVNEGDLCI